MSYTPNTWKSGDVVTSAKLNNIEQGIVNAGAMIIHATATDTATVLDRTWQGIHDADFAVVVDSDSGALFGFVQSSQAPLGSGAYVTGILFIDDTNAFSILRFETNSADGYPSYTWE